MSRYTLKKYISRLMAVLLVLSLFLPMVPAVSAAEGEGTCGENLSWSLNEGTLTITGSGAMTDFPYETKAPWYSLRNEILRVELPQGLTSVGNFAFWECGNITTMTIPDSVTRIGDFAFKDCYGIRMLVLGNGLRSIGESAFSDCVNVVDISLPAGLQSIGMKAFYRCESITAVTVPASVTEMGMMVFGYCKSLVTANIQSRIVVVPDWLFYECRNLVQVVLPDTADSISTNAFDGCEQLGTVYYDGENKTAEEIQQIIAEALPEFGENGYVGSDNPTGTTSAGTVTDNGDGTITQENTTVIQGDESKVTSEITVVRPSVESTGGEYTAEITVTVGSDEGWKEAQSAIDTAINNYQNTVSGSGGNASTPTITIYVKDINSIDRDILQSVAGKDIILIIYTEDGSVWKIRGLDLDPENISATIDLRFDLTPGSGELCEELGVEKYYELRFRKSAQVNAEVMVGLHPSLSLQNATLFEGGEETTRIQSSVIDNQGFAHFYLAAVSEEIVYYIAINVPQAEQEAIVPEVIQQAYGSPQFIEPIKYEITGRKSSWNMTFGQVTWIMAAVLVGCVVVVGFVMFALNKRKLSMGYVPDLDDEDYE